MGLVLFLVLAGAAIAVGSSGKAKSRKGAAQADAARRAQAAAQSASAGTVAGLAAPQVGPSAPLDVIETIVGALRTDSVPEIHAAADDLEARGFVESAADLRAVASAVAFSGDTFAFGADDWSGWVEQGQAYAAEAKGYYDEIERLFGAPPAAPVAPTLDAVPIQEVWELNREIRALALEREQLEAAPRPAVVRPGWFVSDGHVSDGSWGVL